MKKLLLVLGILVALLLVSTGQAAALNNWKWTGGIVWQAPTNGSGRVCVKATSEIGNGPYGGGAMRGTGRYFKKYPHSNCANTGYEYVAKPGWIQVKLDLWVRNFLLPIWENCRSVPYRSNASRTSYYTVYWFQPNGGPPCGNSGYATVTTTYVWNGSAWKGGGLQSPSYVLSYGFTGAPTPEMEEEAASIPPLSQSEIDSVATPPIDPPDDPICYPSSIDDCQF